MAKLHHIDLINEMVAAGYINVQKHPFADLYIYNYSKQATFDNMWNEATNQCRGIICDADMNIVARPFEKFYNYEELIGKGVEIPNLPFEVFDKLDGSLGIMYFVEGVPYIATRGSFTSTQAEHANQVLNNKYSDKFDALDRTKTYLFEIIYPDHDSCLVVDYGDTDDIFLIAVIDTETGEEYSTDDYKHIFNIATRYDGITDYLKVREIFSGENKEGFVIKFANNFRMKLKFEEYFRLHALMSNISDKSVLEAMMNGTVEDTLNTLKEFSEEKQIYYNSVVDKYTKKFNEIVDTCKAEFRNGFESRREAAEYYKTCTYPGIMFMMMDGRDYTSSVWRIIWNIRTKI